MIKTVIHSWKCQLKHSLLLCMWVSIVCRVIIKATMSFCPSTGLQSWLSLLFHWPLQQPDVGHHLQHLLRPEQGKHAGRARRDGQRGLPLCQQHAHQQWVHRHEPGQHRWRRRPRTTQGGHSVRSRPHRQRQDWRVWEVRTRDSGEFYYWPFRLNC